MHLVVVITGVQKDDVTFNFYTYEPHIFPCTLIVSKRDEEATVFM